MTRTMPLTLLVVAALVGCAQPTRGMKTGPETLSCEAFRSQVVKGEVKSIAVLNSKAVLLTLQSGKEVRLQAGCEFDPVAFAQKNAPNRVLIALE